MSNQSEIKRKKLAELSSILDIFSAGFANEAEINTLGTITKFLEEHDNRLKQCNNIAVSGARMKKGVVHFQAVWSAYIHARKGSNVNLQDAGEWTCFGGDLESLPPWVKRPILAINTKKADRNDTKWKEFFDNDEATNEFADITLDTMENGDYEEPEEEVMSGDNSNHNDTQEMFENHSQVNNMEDSNASHNNSIFVAMGQSITSKVNQKMTQLKNVGTRFSRSRSKTSNNLAKPGKNNASSTPSKGRKRSIRQACEQPASVGITLSSTNGAKAPTATGLSPPNKIVNTGNGTTVPAQLPPVNADDAFWQKMTNIVATQCNMAMSASVEEITSILAENSLAISENNSKINAISGTVTALNNRVVPELAGRVDGLETKIKLLLKNDEDIDQATRESYYNLFRAKCESHKATLDEIMDEGRIKIDINDQSLLNLDDNGRVNDVRLDKLNALISLEVSIIRKQYRREGKAVSVYVKPAAHVHNKRSKILELLKRRKTFNGKLGISHAVSRHADFSAIWWDWKRLNIIKNFSPSFKGFMMLELHNGNRVKVTDPESFALLQGDFRTAQQIERLGDEAEAFPYDGKIYATPGFHRDRIGKIRAVYEERDRIAREQQQMR